MPFANSVRKSLTDYAAAYSGFRATPQQDFQRMQGEIMRPLIEKADAAIKKVAKQQGFIYVFDVSVGSVVYYSDASIDILPCVKKRVGH